MRVLARLGLLVLIVLCTVSRPTRVRADQRDFWVLNDTGQEIQQIFVSPHEANNWESDLLERASLPAGLGFKVTFGSRYLSSCVMDIKLTFTGGGSEDLPAGYQRLRPQRGGAPAGPGNLPGAAVRVGIAPTRGSIGLGEFRSRRVAGELFRVCFWRHNRVFRWLVRTGPKQNIAPPPPGVKNTPYRAGALA